MRILSQVPEPSSPPRPPPRPSQSLLSLVEGLLLLALCGVPLPPLHNEPEGRRASVTLVLTQQLEKASLRQVQALVSGPAVGGTRSPRLVSPVEVWALPGAGTRVCPTPGSDPCMAGQPVCLRTQETCCPAWDRLFFSLLPAASASCWNQPFRKPQSSRALPSGRGRSWAWNHRCPGLQRTLPLLATGEVVFICFRKLSPLMLVANRPFSSVMLLGGSGSRQQRQL